MVSCNGTNFLVSLYIFFSDVRFQNMLILFSIESMEGLLIVMDQPGEVEKAYEITYFSFLFLSFFSLSDKNDNAESQKRKKN